MKTGFDERAEREWVVGEDRVRFLLEANPNALVLVGEDGIITYANRRACAAFGYDSEELAGQAIEDLVPERVAQRHARHRTVFREAPRHRQMGIGMDLTARRRDGSEFPVEVALSPIYLDGRRQVIAAVVDITERKDRQHVRDAFIDVLSHELRTPITTIYGASRLILRDGAAMRSRHGEILADLAEEADRLNRIVENLVVLAKLERGAEIPGIEPVLLQRLLPSLVKQEKAHNPALAVTLRLPDDLPPVAADEMYVAQVLRNLLSNAVKYGPPEGPVEVTASDSDIDVTVRVLDVGHPLDSSEYDRMFELYYRSAETARAAPGAGIGLFVCRKLIEAMGGRMWAGPREHAGSEFAFSLPRYEV